MQNWPSADDDAVRAAAALVATPIPVMPGEVVGDELRLRCFSNAHDTLDRVGLETDFAAVKRRRPDLGSCGVIVPRGVPTNAVVQQDCVVAMPRLVSLDEEAAERQYELLTQLSDSNMSLAFALEHHVAQARKVGIPLSAACYSRLVELAAASDDMARLMDLLDEMRRNDVVLTSHTLNLSIRAVAEKNAAVALTLLDTVPDAQVSRRTWRLVANRILSDAVVALLAVQAGASPFPPGVSMSRVAGIVERAGGSERFDPVLAVALAAASALLSASPVESLTALSTALARCTDEDQQAAANPLAAVAVSVLLRRACDTSDGSSSSAADRPAARLAIVQAAKQHGVHLHAQDFASLFRACKTECDTRGVVYFLMLHAAGTASVDAAIAAGEMLANDIFDADVRASLGVSRTRAFKAFVDKADLLRASVVSLPERMRVVDGVAKLARHDWDVDVLMSLLANNLLPYLEAAGPTGCMVASTVRRTVAATTRSLPAWSKGGPSAGQRAAAAIAADGADPRLMAAVFAGLAGAAELESAAMQAMPAFGSSDVVGAMDATAVGGLVGRPSIEGVYIMVLDAAAWAQLAADPKAAAAVAKMMSAYDKAAGGCLIIGLDAVFLAPDTEPLAASPKPTKARAATLAAEWAKLYPGWFRLLPLCCSVAAAAPPSDIDDAVDDGMWWITAWASQLRAAGAKKQVTVVGSRAEAAATAAVAAKVAERAGVKPVLAAGDLLKKLGV